MVVGPAGEAGHTAPLVGIVSGSGLDLRPLLDKTDRELGFAEAGVPPAGTAGHEGVFRFGRCGDTPVVLQAGRIHLYEGHRYEQAVSTVDALYRFGVRTLILTNAAGGLDPALAPGDLVAAESVLPWKYRAHPFPARLRPAIVVPGCTASGVYVWMHGPCYETRAEICALQSLGGTVVGMSAAAELERCEALGIRAGVISCVTNNCTVQEPVSHEQVVAVAEHASGALRYRIRAYLRPGATGTGAV